ncbi:hypothetical protein [Microbacterium terrisoli]|uniref:hypothetical protein n=1 Tax=Microbacterium terrisoli TaxID=3242192 RepID=UPI002804CA8C|nr:hypothetical protein [Microbacterium protaetiae]
MTDIDMFLVMEPHALADPRIITNVQLPRKLDTRAWAKNYAASDICSKGSQHSDPKR